MDMEREMAMKRYFRGVGLPLIRKSFEMIRNDSK